MYFYTAYGYTIASEFCLPGFSSILRCNTDISISRQKTFHPLHRKPRVAISVHKLADGLQIDWPGVASYKILNGREIIVISEPGALSELEIQPLYGLALATILQQKKHMILHGSSVEVNGRVVVVAGNKGIGKSTVTTFLVAAGHGFVSDDVTALTRHDNSFTYVLPGIPRVKLWPDAVRALGRNPNELPLVSASIPKHILMCPDQFSNSTLPLQAIAMLDYGKTIEILEMTEQEKMLSLLGGQYLARFQHLLPVKAQEDIFHSCASLARKTNIVKLKMPRDIGSLPASINLLERLAKQGKRI